MDAEERLYADYAGTGLTIGPHPMAFRRHDLTMRGVLRAIDLPQARDGRRVRVAGMVITRQRPGTAKMWVYSGCQDQRVVADVLRLDKGHTEGLEPKVTEEIVKLMVSAKGGRAQAQ